MDDNWAYLFYILVIFVVELAMISLCHSLSSFIFNI